MRKKNQKNEEKLKELGNMQYENDKLKNEIQFQMNENKSLQEIIQEKERIFKNDSRIHKNYENIVKE